MNDECEHPGMEGFVRLIASAPIRADPDRLAAVLEDPARFWPEARRALDDVPSLRRFEVDLRLRLGGRDAGVTTFRKAALLDIARPRKTLSGWEAEISWRAAAAAPLFPVFSGLLVVERERFGIEGLYAPPGGLLGCLADRALLHLAANATARWLLGELDRAALGAAG